LEGGDYLKFKISGRNWGKMSNDVARAYNIQGLWGAVLTTEDGTPINQRLTKAGVKASGEGHIFMMTGHTRVKVHMKEGLLTTSLGTRAHISDDFLQSGPLIPTTISPVSISPRASCTNGTERVKDTTAETKSEVIYRSLTSDF
jgi:hypothetical protein